MNAAEAAPQTTTATLLTAADSAVQSSNVELRERFLRILEWLPSRSVSAQMFGDIRLEGQLVAVDPTNFDYYLVNNLKTPMGVVEHAALRTRDTIYLEIALDDADEEDEGKIVEQQQQQLDNTAKVPDEGAEQRP
uniref:Gem-associated protein 7 n=1 Tax=Globodera rostochiensis TaxID=31243 RepID=A0A914GTF8_GLORO